MTNTEKFHQELCDLIDKHSDSTEDKHELIKSLDEFSDVWTETYSVTGLFWVTKEEVQNINNK